MCWNTHQCAIKSWRGSIPGNSCSASSAVDNMTVVVAQEGCVTYGADFLLKSFHLALQSNLDDIQRCCCDKNIHKYITIKVMGIPSHNQTADYKLTENWRQHSSTGRSDNLLRGCNSIDIHDERPVGLYKDGSNLREVISKRVHPEIALAFLTWSPIEYLRK